MEKSLRNAATTSATAAAVIATKLAMPARRAVSPRRSPTSGRNSAMAPKTREYAVRASARTRAKLPKKAIEEESHILPESLPGRKRPIHLESLADGPNKRL